MATRTRSTTREAKIDSARDQLPRLLAELNGGKALDPTVLAAIGGDADVNPNHPHNATIDKLFVEHVGKSPSVVVGNAIRVAQDELDIEGDIFNKIQDRTYSGDEREKWFNHPQSEGFKGPVPDGKVWVALFLGKARADDALKGLAKMNGDDQGFICPPGDDGNTKNDDDGIAREEAIMKLLDDEASKLPTIDLLSNILLYVREKANGVEKIEDLLRFSVVYGFDGVMKDILEGRYGFVSFNVNALLPLNNDVIKEDSMYRLFGGGRLYMPAYAIAAILGYTNVTVAALAQPGGTLDAAYGVQRNEDGDIQQFSDQHDLPSHILFWVFMKNMPEMLTCLMKECGFQFRWIEHHSFLPKIQARLFDAAEYESSPRWTDLDAMDLMYAGGSRSRCRMRSAAAYKKQMEMLDLLISLGFPMSLFFDTDKLTVVLEREGAVFKAKKLNTRDQCKALMRNMTKDERKAREKLYEACCVYNSLQGYDSDSEEEETTDEKTLTLGGYYSMLKSKWDGQVMQADRLPEFEALDSRWRETRHRENGEEEEDSAPRGRCSLPCCRRDRSYDSDSYRDSDDGSSYGAPPGWE